MLENNREDDHCHIQIPLIEVDHNNTLKLDYWPTAY
jgi:hypothetical protein